MVRWITFIDWYILSSNTLSSNKPNYHQRCLKPHIPKLAAKPFFDTSCLLGSFQAECCCRCLFVLQTRLNLAFYGDFRFVAGPVPGPEQGLARPVTGPSSLDRSWRTGTSRTFIIRDPHSTAGREPTSSPLLTHFPTGRESRARTLIASELWLRAILYWQRVMAVDVWTEKITNSSPCKENAYAHHLRHERRFRQIGQASD